MNKIWLFLEKAEAGGLMEYGAGKVGWSLGTAISGSLKLTLEAVGRTRKFLTI